MRTIEEIINGFNDYCAKHEGKEPDAVVCAIRFYGDDEVLETFIKLNCEYEDHEDDNFIFYCDHINHFLDLLGEGSNCEDFYVREVYEFINSKEYFVR
jgi:hypothetical protein